MKTYLIIRTESDNPMSSSLIENLVVQAKNRDAEAFGELYSYYAKDMYRFALYYTGQAYLAEDAVSEAVLNAFQNIEKLQKVGSFKPWLFSILFNCCKRRRRKKHLRFKGSSFRLLRVFLRKLLKKAEKQTFKAFFPCLRRTKERFFCSPSSADTAAKRLEKCFQ